MRKRRGDIRIYCRGIQVMRFFVSTDCVEKDTIHIRGREFHHLVDVVRAREGDKVRAFDGTGVEYHGTIIKVKSKEAVVRIEFKEAIKEESAIKITLAQAIPKKRKMDDIIEKVTEVGVDTVIPLRTDRTVVNISEEQTGLKIVRWNKIAIEASKQCGRVRPPNISGIKKFLEVLDNIKEYELALMPTLYEKEKDLKSVIRGRKLNSVITFIGPEGDFSEEEVNSAKEAGCRTVSLGNNILKTDTAAIAVLSILKYELG
ncbi:MAG: 16S rRNA (uracil(1498)-N(3))-methyltransferase [Candidatus Omnitrophica bacterium]|nr:16S rRNA (uracil(1498)-N(3))-methyltransferase [Candidatus Omnitrophota bacterium]